MVAEARKAQRMSEVDLYVQASPEPAAPQPAAGPPWYVAFPLGFAALIGGLRALKALRRRG